MAKQSDPMALDYEERNLPLRALVVWVGILFGSLAGVLALVYYLYGTPHSRPEPDLVLNRPMNQPVLQSQGKLDMKRFRAQQQEIVSTYGWVNRSQGIVRVPIDRAMEMLLERGLPARRGGRP